MTRIGPCFAVSIAAGIVAGSSLLPVTPMVATLATAAFVGVVRTPAGLALAAPFGLGLVRAAVRATGESDWDGPRYIEGRVEIDARLGAGVTIRARGARVLVSDPPGGFPGPGYTVRGRFRVDPVNSRGDPSAFDAHRWARAQSILGRARPLGAFESVEPAPGIAAAVRRALDRTRARALARLEAGEGSPVVVALVLGDRTDLDDSREEAFRDAGLAHVLALSGMHAGVLALGLGAILATLRVRGWLAWTFLAVALAAFAVLTGARAPILRAVAGASLASAARQTGRRSDALNHLGWTASVLLLVEPLLLFDVGFRLSFTAAAILALISQRSVLGAERGFVRGVLDALEVSAVVTLATIPEIAGSFGRVSLLSPLSNLFATLPATAALGWGALAAFAPVPEELARAWASAAAASGRALTCVAELAARVPGGRVDCSALPVFAAPVALGATVALALRRRVPRSAWRAGAILLVLAFFGEVRPVDRLTVIDVGQGDGVLWEGPLGSGLVDGGPPGWNGRLSACAAAVAIRGVRPATLIATHGHADHYGGLVDLNAQPREILVPARAGDAPEAFDEWLASRAADGVSVVPVSHEWIVRGRLRVRSPWPEPPSLHDENDFSLSSCWTVRGTVAWLLGDQAKSGEEAFLASADSVTMGGILLAPHHGSRDSTSDALLERLAPRLVLISCGTGNPHGHPHAELLDRVRAAGAAHLRTDRDGTITITPTRNGFRFRWHRGFPGPRAFFPAIVLSPPAGFS